jgi:hypothetical protein
MSNLSKEFDKVFKDLRTDPYASEAETDALIKPDPRGPAEKRLHTMMDERGAWEQGAESFSVLRDIALELLTEQIKASTNDRRTKACLMACEGVSTKDLEAVMVNTGPLLKNKLAEVDLLRATNANLRAQPAQKAIEWPNARDVGRYGDMSPSAHLRVGLDTDNDVYLSVWDESGGASIEFCTPGAGGGASPATRMALISLMLAIEQDNAQRPDKDWWAKRKASHERAIETARGITKGGTT